MVVAPALGVTPPVVRRGVPQESASPERSSAGAKPPALFAEPESTINIPRPLVRPLVGWSARLGEISAHQLSPDPHNVRKSLKLARGLLDFF